MKRGRTAMSKEDLVMLREAVKGQLSYVEIGVLWGGSLIEAAKAEPQLRLWGIDPFEGYYGGKDDWTDPRETPTMADALINIHEAGIVDRVTLVKAKSNPFPLPGLTFDVGLIDGDHTLIGVVCDWVNLRSRCKRVLFHDIDDPEIGAFVDCIKGWKKTYTKRMARLDRD